MTALILNLVLFQVAWWACVLGAANQLPWLGPLVMLVPVAWWLATATHTPTAFRSLLSLAALGFALDLLLAGVGYVRFPEQPLLLGLCPPWMLALWFGFGTLLDRSLGWMRSSILAQALFGVLGAPLAYYGAGVLGALEVTQPAAWVAIAVGWGAVLVVIYRLLLPPVRDETPASTLEVSGV